MNQMTFCGSFQYGLKVCASIVQYTSTNIHQPISSNSTPVALSAAENYPFLCSLSAISSLKQLPSRFRKWEGKVDKVVDPKRPDMKSIEKHMGLTQHDMIRLKSPLPSATGFEGSNPSTPRGRCASSQLTQTNHQQHIT